jgi:hypothetical protein
MDAETHNILSENKKGKAFQWGSGGQEAEACTPPGVELRYLWGVVFDVLPHLHNCCCDSDGICARYFHECCGI